MPFSGTTEAITTAGCSGSTKGVQKLEQHRIQGQMSQQTRDSVFFLSLFPTIIVRKKNYVFVQSVYGITFS